MKRNFSLLAGVLLLGLTGCTTSNPYTAPIVRSLVATATSVGIDQDPSIVPELQAADAVICAAAGQGVVDPVAVANQLNAAGVLKDQTAKTVVEGALATYNLAIAFWGAGITTSVAQPFLLGVCQGMQDALPNVMTSARPMAKPIAPIHIK